MFITLILLLLLGLKNSVMIGSIIGAGISTIGNLVGAGINNNYAKQQMKLQNELNKEYFDYTSEYNSPFNQVGRLKAAGLNPALAVSNGVQNTQSAVGSSTIPNVNYASSLGSDAVNAANAAAQIETQKIQNENVKADTTLKEEQANTEQSKQSSIDVDNVLKQQETIARKLDNAIKRSASPDIIKAYKQQLSLLTNQVATEIQKTRLNESQSYLNEQNAWITRENREIMLPLQKLLLSAQINATNASAIASRAAASLSLKQVWALGELTPKQKEELTAKIEKARKPGVVGDTYNTIVSILKDAADGVINFSGKLNEYLNAHPTVDITDVMSGPSM